MISKEMLIEHNKAIAAEIAGHKTAIDRLEGAQISNNIWIKKVLDMEGKMAATPPQHSALDNGENNG
jgi:hypothetical protein